MIVRSLWGRVVSRSSYARPKPENAAHGPASGSQGRMGFWTLRGRDCTISVRGKRYQLPADLIGRHVWVGVLGNTITIEHSRHVVATFAG